MVFSKKIKIFARYFEIPKTIDNLSKELKNSKWRIAKDHGYLDNLTLTNIDIALKLTEKSQKSRLSNILKVAVTKYGLQIVYQIIKKEHILFKMGFF